MLSVPKTNSLANIALLTVTICAGVVGYQDRCSRQQRDRLEDAVRCDTDFTSKAFGIELNGTAETKEIASLARELPRALGKLLHRLGEYDPVIRERLQSPIALNIVRDSSWQHSRSHDCAATNDGGFAIRLEAIREFIDQKRYPWIANYDQQQAADIFAARILPIIAGITVQRQMVERLRASGSSELFVASAEAFGLVGTHEYAAAVIAYDSLPVDLRICTPDIQRHDSGLLEPWIPDSLSWISGYQPRCRWHAPNDLAQLASSLCNAPQASAIANSAGNQEASIQIPSRLACLRILERCGFSPQLAPPSTEPSILDENFFPQATIRALVALQLAQDATLRSRLHDLGIECPGGKLMLPNAVVSCATQGGGQSRSTELTRALVSIAGHLAPAAVDKELTNSIGRAIELCGLDCCTFVNRLEDAAFLSSLSDDRFAGLELGYTIQDLHRLTTLLPDELRQTAQSKLSRTYQALCTSLVPLVAKELAASPISRSLRLVHSELIDIGYSCGYLSATEAAQLHGTVTPLSIAHLASTYPSDLISAFTQLSPDEQRDFLKAAVTENPISIHKWLAPLSETTKRLLLRWIAKQGHCPNEGTLTTPLHLNKVAISPWEQLAQILEVTEVLPLPARDHIIQALTSLPPSERFWAGYEDLLNPRYFTIPTAAVPIAIDTLHRLNPQCPTLHELVRSATLKQSQTGWPESVTVITATDSLSPSWGNVFSEALISRLRPDLSLPEVFQRATSQIAGFERYILDPGDANVQSLPIGRYSMFPQARFGASPVSTPDAALIIAGDSIENDPPLQFQHEAERWRSALSDKYKCHSTIVGVRSERELQDALLSLYYRAPGGSLIVIFLCHGIQSPADAPRYAHAVPEGVSHSASFRLSDQFILREERLRHIVWTLPPDASYQFLFNSCHSGAVVE